jgi:hypothetical protein
MATLQQARRYVKPARSVRVLAPATAGGPGVLVQITVGAEANDYCVRKIPSDFGDGFEVAKVSGPERPTYHVHLSDEHGQTCECLGYLRWGSCKHTGGIAALRQAGKL